MFQKRLYLRKHFLIFLHSLIVAVGTGVTHGGTATSLTVAAGQTGVFTFVVTSSTAIVFYRTATGGTAV